MQNHRMPEDPESIHHHTLPPSTESRESPAYRCLDCGACLCHNCAQECPGKAPHRLPPRPMG